MSADVSTKVEMDASGFNAQARALIQTVKTIGQEMKTTEAKLEQSGTAVDKLEAKYSGLKRQLDAQKQASEKYNLALQQVAKTQEKAQKQLAETKQKYEEQKKAGTATNKMLTDYERKIAKQEKAVARANTAYAKNQAALLKSKEAEYAFEAQITKTEKALNKEQSRITKLNKSFISCRKAGEDIDAATQPLQRLSAVTAAGAVAAVKFAIDFEDGFANVEKTVDGTKEQLDGVKQSIIDMSTIGINGHSALPQTTAELNELAAAGGKFGIETENIAGFTETMAMMGSATNLAGEEGAKTLARFMNVTATSQDKIQNLGSSIVDLGNHFATTEAEIADMAMNMGATGNAAGISAPDILAYATALSSLGTGADAGGSAISRIWMDIHTAVSEGGNDLAAFAKTSGKTSAEFAEAWKNNAGGAFKDFITGLSQSGDIIGSLQKLGFNNIRDLQVLQKLAGPDGIQLLNEALERSNKAWSENTALVTEFEKKAGTTASQMKITRNNIIEAGRAVGETFLPMVNNGAVSVKDFAQSISRMNIHQKESLASVGKWVISLGAASKGASLAMKGVGNFGDALKEINDIKDDAKFIEQMGPWLKMVGATAPLAVAGIAALAAGVWAGKKAYDAWYKSNYAWTDGLSEGNKAVKESFDKYKQLNEIQGKIKNLKLTIESPDSSKEQVDEAKTKLEEIKEILSKEYNLVIKSDNSNLDAAVENVKKMSKNQLTENWIKQQERLTKLQGKFNDYQKDYAEAYNKYETALTDAKRYSDARSEIAELKKSGLEAGEYFEKLREILSWAGFDAKGTTVDSLLSLERRLDESFRLSEKNVTEYKNKVDSLTAANKEYIAISTEMANWASEGIGMAVQAGDAEEANEWFGALADTINRAKLNMHDYAQVAAEAFNGVSWNDAWTSGGDALNNMVNDYIRSMQKFGAANSDIARGAASLKNGFKSISDIPKDNKQAFEAVSNDLTEFARSLGEIDGEHSIKITAEGDTVIINDTEQKIEKIKSESGINVSVGADGDISILNSATDKTTFLTGLGSVHLEVNADGDIEILDEANQKIAVINKETGWITVNGDYEGADEVQKAIDDQNQIKDTDVKQSVTGSFDGKEEIETALRYQNELKNKTVDYRVKYSQIGSPAQFPTGNAKGTQDFKGGLAMINDEKGKADPRELVEVNGKGYIFEGKDVVVPLPKHAKVYTADQTRQIMSGNVPHYAKGKDTTAFESAKKAFTHRQKTSEVSVVDELEWWKAISKTIKLTQEEAEEVEEEIYALNKKLNEDSISDYKKRISNQVTDGERWLENQKKMYNISYDKQIEILNRIDKRYLDTLNEMVDNTEMTEKEKDEIYAEYYKAHEDRIIQIAELEKQKNKEVFEALAEDSKNYVSDRNYYNDWGDYADNPIEAWKRVKQRYDDMIASETDTDRINELKKELKQFGQDMYDQRKEDSERWMDTEEYYGRLSDKEKIAAIERRKKWVKEYYEAGIIDHREYLNGIQDLDKAHTEVVQKQLDEAVKKFYTAERKKLDAKRDSIEKEYSDIEERETNEERQKKLDELKKQAAIYDDAVTKEGAEKLKDINEQIEDLEKEALNSKRNKEKESRLKAVDDEINSLEEKQEQALSATLKTVSDMVKKAEEGTGKTSEELSAFLKRYAKQQEEVQRIGTETLAGVISQLNRQLADVTNAGAAMYNYYNNRNYTDNRSTVTVHQNITERIQGDAYASALARRIANNGKVGW